MRAFVVTILDMSRSVDVAARCVESGRAFGVDVETWPATTPTDDPERVMAERGFSTAGFQNNRYSRYLPCLATFCSHSGLWAKCANEGEALLILEHDAVFVDALPGYVGGPDDDSRHVNNLPILINFGRPSFGRFAVPADGMGPLVSKPYLPGAHAYAVWPLAARALLEKARTEARPTDVFLSLARFPFITEYYPWPVVCRDSFTTIQGPEGCKAKHNKVEIV